MKLGEEVVTSDSKLTLLYGMPCFPILCRVMLYTASCSFWVSDFMNWTKPSSSLTYVQTMK